MSCRSHHHPARTQCDAVTADPTTAQCNKHSVLTVVDCILRAAVSNASQQIEVNNEARDAVIQRYRTMQRLRRQRYGNNNMEVKDALH